jgi:hypothetical protein
MVLLADTYIQILRQTAVSKGDNDVEDGTNREID